MRLMLVDNVQWRRYGKVRLGPGRKMACGAVRNDWRLCEFSDRDLLRYLSPIGIRAIGKPIVNRKFVETARNFKPDLLLLGHCETITNESLHTVRKLLPHVKIAHFNVDPLWQRHTQQQIEDRLESCDGIFATTAGETLRQWTTGRNVVAYMPNPSDTSYEINDNGKKRDFARDIFFAAAMNPANERYAFIRELHDRLARTEVRAEWFSMFGRPPVFGAEYEEVLATSKMAFNLNRKEGDKWYSSDRIAQLMGNGLLTFQSSANEMQTFFSDSETVYFDGLDDLVDKVVFYNSHDEERARIASAGRAKYHALFNGARVLRFMADALLGKDWSEPYGWESEVYR